MYVYVFMYVCADPKPAAARRVFGHMIPALVLDKIRIFAPGKWISSSPATLGAAIKQPYLYQKVEDRVV